MAERWPALLGIVVFLALAWACSLDRRRFPWRIVLSGLALQLAFALLILKTAAGRALFEGAQAVVTRLIGFANEGARLVFGPLAQAETLERGFGPGNALILAVTITATIILIAALSALLYHWGVLQRVVAGFGWVMRRVMGTSGSESLAAAANIFMGQTEAPLVVQPYLKGMTRSELMALMTGGMATIAGGVGAVYASLGVAAGEPNMAGHLLTASVMNAPAALLVAKIMLPETALSATAGGASARVERTTRNAVDALCAGAGDGLKLALNVLAMLIAFTAVVALANFLLGLVLQPLTGRVLTLQQLLGWVNAPLAWLMGVPAHDAVLVGQFLGERIILNEFVGFLSLTGQRESLDSRSFVIATYALCGFANFASIAIQIGGIGALEPARRADLSDLGLRAMLGGLLACYLTACLAGLLV
ncbi:MAG TPA: nucleoside transporter C-terminal domain-containing protein [Verrucomicrobiota bacterium]|nr:nucleoside transporter C-terminal domain-containing protein [Verrucomicrobiota bacterium]